MSRIQFAVTVGFHFIFPPLTIGLSWFIVWMLWRYKKSGSELYREMSRFWIKIFALSFAVGVATGIAMQFQFGTNWAAYSRFVGDVFGVALAIEAVLAFFLESTFLAVLVFGWKRVSARMLWFASVMVAVGASLSALWILIANSWQHTPAGYQIVNGRAQLTDFWAAAFNPSTVPRFLHTLNACITTGSFFVMGMSAWFILKRQHLVSARITLRASVIVAFISALAQLPLGHYHGVQVAITQPAKLAAYEGLFETQCKAPLILFGVPDSDQERILWAVRIPGLLSLLIHGSVNAEVKGLKDFPRDERPPLEMTFYSFHAMVLIGLYLLALSAVALLLLRKERLETYPAFLKVLMYSIPLPFIANELGWVATEVGRQPWVVYKLLRTKDAISTNVMAGQILSSIILFSALYLLLFAAWIVVLRREFRRGPTPVAENPHK